MHSWVRLYWQSDDDGRKRTTILRDPKEITFLGSQCITGIEVDEEDDEITPRGLLVDERRRVISTDLIITSTPMRMNNHYASLEPVNG